MHQTMIRNLFGRHALIVLACLIASIALLESIDSSVLPWKSWKDSGHALVFGLAMYLMLEVLQQSTSGSRRLPVAAGIGGLLFLAGIAIEIVQPFFGREASFTDITYNLIGIASGIVIFTAFHQQSRQRLLSLAGFVILLGLTLFRPVYDAYVVLKRDQAQPYLLGFENAYEKMLWQPSPGAHISVVEAPVEWKSNTGQTAKISFLSGNYPGLSIPEIYPDWRGYTQLVFEVFSPEDTPVTITVRINDLAHNNKHHDRFNRQLTVKPGKNRYVLPLSEVKNAPQGRQLNIEQVAQVILFTGRPEHSLTLYFDNLHLE